MGKTVESFRIALEGEINRWSGFARALRKPDREAYDELMDIFRSSASESSCASNQAMFELLVMSILLFQQKRIGQIERELVAIKPEETRPSVTQKPTVPVEAEPVHSSKPAREGGQLRLF